MHGQGSRGHGLRAEPIQARGGPARLDYRLGALNHWLVVGCPHTPLTSKAD
jgi:hypothetical protein